jgi:large subunit ribosomal protein L9
MEIILREDVDELGLEGDIVHVANGYARNYLIPKGIALKSSPQNRKVFEQQKKKIEARRMKAKEDAERLKQEIGEKVLNFSLKAGEDGKLYGSVTSMDIAASLEKQGFTFNRRKILLDRPIKSTGDFQVPIKLYPEVVGLVKVVVIQEKPKKVKAAPKETSKNKPKTSQSSRTKTTVKATAKKTEKMKEEVQEK